MQLKTLFLTTLPFWTIAFVKEKNNFALPPDQVFKIIRRIFIHEYQFYEHLSRVPDPNHCYPLSLNTLKTSAIGGPSLIYLMHSCNDEYHY